MTGHRLRRRAGGRGSADVTSDTFPAPGRPKGRPSTRGAAHPAARTNTPFPPSETNGTVRAPGFRNAPIRPPPIGFRTSHVTRVPRT